MTPTAAYFRRLGPQHYRPTEHTAGAWAADEQHLAPVCGLLVHAVERVLASGGAAAGRDLALARISFDVLGRIPLADVEITVDVLRPGRTIELVEATLTCGGRPIIRARAWLLSRQDTSAVAGGGPEALPGPDRAPSWAMGSVWPGGFVASLDVRAVDPPTPGRARAWVSTRTALVADEDCSELARYVGLIDTANGVGVRQPPQDWMFPNVDLTVHLYRQPTGRWLGLDTTVVFGSEGQGLTSSTLYDIDGPVGRAEQILTVRHLRR